MTGFSTISPGRLGHGFKGGEVCPLFGHGATVLRGRARRSQTEEALSSTGSGVLV